MLPQKLLRQHFFDHIQGECSVWGRLQIQLRLEILFFQLPH